MNKNFKILLYIISISFSNLNYSKFPEFHSGFRNELFPIANPIIPKSSILETLTENTNDKFQNNVCFVPSTEFLNWMNQKYQNINQAYLSNIGAYALSMKTYFNLLFSKASPMVYKVANFVLNHKLMLSSMLLTAYLSYKAGKIKNKSASAYATATGGHVNVKVENHIISDNEEVIADQERTIKDQRNLIIRQQTKLDRYSNHSRNCEYIL